MKKTQLKLNKKTRQVEKEPVVSSSGREDLPVPEPIKLSADIKQSAEAPKNGAPAAAPAQAPTDELKLDLACGQSPKEGHEGVDLYAANAKHKVDLFRFPWPWKDSSVDEINSSHFIEHIPVVHVCEKHGHEVMPCKGAQDLFFAFFDECYRILKPGGRMNIVCPAVRSERAFWDPTHRRFIAQMTFFYLSKDWRAQNKLDHYLVKCNFSGDVNFSFGADYASRHEEVQKDLFAHAWNVIQDWLVVLKAIKP